MGKLLRASGIAAALFVALVAVVVGVLVASPSVRSNLFGRVWLACLSHSDLHHDKRVSLLSQVLPSAGSDVNEELRVLEIGPGDGINLSILSRLNANGDSRLIRWEGMEPNPVLFDALQKRISLLNDTSITAVATQQKADEFFASVADDTYDAAISVLVLCTVPEPQRIVAELRRVLKPGGKFYFLEHVGYPHGTTLRSLQEFINPAWSIIGDGCELDRDTLSTIKLSGFSHVDHEAFVLDVPVMKYISGSTIMGVATK